MALALTVTVVALLAIMVVDFMSRAWVDTAMAATYRDETKALYAARSGLEAAKLMLMVKERGMELEGLTPETAAAGIPLPVGEDYVFFSIIDESGKLDLNQLVTDKGYPDERTIQYFQRLLARLELDPNLAWAVVDWLDADSEPRFAGAETLHYSGLEPPYTAKNSKFDSVDELALVKGFEPKVMVKIRGHLTVWSSGKLNINTATPMALLALDDAITEGMVQELIMARQEKPFKSINEISSVPGFSDVFPRIALLIGVSSKHYMVQSSAMLNETSKTVIAVYMVSPTAADTLYYKTL